MTSTEEQAPRKFSPEEIARYKARVNSPAWQRRIMRKQLAFAIANPEREYFGIEAIKRLDADAANEPDRHERRRIRKLRNLIARGLQRVQLPRPRPCRLASTARAHRPRCRRASLARLASSGGDSGDEGEPEPGRAWQGTPCPENASGPLAKRADSRAAQARADATVAPISIAGQAASVDDVLRFGRIVARMRQRFDCSLTDVELWAMVFRMGLDGLEAGLESADQTLGARRWP